MKRKLIQFPRNIKPTKVILEVGGSIDSYNISFKIYGRNLIPSDITNLLGVSPSDESLRGSRKTPRSSPLKHGFWRIKRSGSAPIQPSEVLNDILNILPKNKNVWKYISNHYNIVVSFGLFLNSWNRGFDISPADLKRLSEIGARVSFDIYGP